MIKSLKFEETCCHSNTSEKPSAHADAKNSQGGSKLQQQQQ